MKNWEGLSIVDMKVKKIKVDNSVTENKEVVELKNQLARALADYDNLRKRVEAEREVVEKVSTVKILARLLPVLEMFISAQSHLKDSGLEIVIGEFKRSLFDLGLEEIQIKLGDKFDPTFAEVTETVDGDTDGKIVEIVEMGWKIAGEEFIIRPAKVKVMKVKEIGNI